MVERCWQLMPGVAIWAVIGLSSLLFYRFVISPALLRRAVNKAWRDSHVAIRMLAGAAAIVFIMPIVEELIFRLPLLLLFDEPVGTGRVGIVVTSVLFGLVHLMNDHTDYSSILTEDYADVPTYKSELARIKAEARQNEPGKAWAKSIAQVMFATGLGLVLGFEGLTHRSLTLCIAIHAAWNACLLLVLLPLLVFLFFVAALIWVACSRALDLVLGK